MRPGDLRREVELLQVLYALTVDPCAPNLSALLRVSSNFELA
jgi:hypothetical protein